MHQILAYWDLFVDKVKPHHEVISALSTGIIAVLTIVLAYVAWRQVRDARVLQRAYVAVTFNGIKTNSAGQLVGHVIFKNAGHMPAQKFCWRVHLDGSGSGWKPPKIKIMEGVSVIPVGSEWPMRTDPFDHPQEEQRVYFSMSGAARHTMTDLAGERDARIFATAILGKCEKRRLAEALA